MKSAFSLGLISFCLGATIYAEQSELLVHSSIDIDAISKNLENNLPPSERDCLYEKLGDLYLKENRFKDAWAAYNQIQNKAVLKQKRAKIALFAKIALLFQQKKYEDLVLTVQNAQSRLSVEDSGEFDFYLGKSYYAQGEVRKAVTHLTSWASKQERDSKQLRSAHLSLLRCAEELNDPVLFKTSSNYLSDPQELTPAINPPSEPSVETVILAPAGDASCCGNSDHPSRIEVRHIEGNGIGYNTGYSTLGAFFSGNHLVDGWTSFADVRGHVFNDGRFALNTGVGARYLSDCMDWALGGNLYYDWRRTNRKSFNQIGLGFEALSPIWEVRANGYIPVANRKSRFFGSKFKKFKGNSVVLQSRQEMAMYGVDAEVGAHWIKWSDIDVFAGIGPYYFAGEGSRDFVGGKIRLNGRWKEYVTLEGSISYDRVFKDIYQAQIAFSLPLGRRKPVMKRECVSCCSSVALNRRLIQPIVRDEIIVVEKTKQKSLAVNPATGLPFNVLFVDNLSHSLGTFESPYATLVAAENASIANDIIYVFPGDGTNRNMDAGISLKNGQQFLGSSTAQTINTTFGPITIEPQTTVLTPTIASLASGSLLITVANNNVISGFYMQGTASTPNAVNANNVSGLVIKNNTVQMSHTAFNLTNVGGVVAITNNTLSLPTASSEPCLMIDNTNVNNANYSIINNAFLANDNNVAGMTMDLTDCSNITTSIIANQFLTNRDSIVVNTTNGSIPSQGNVLSILNNTLDSAVDSGVFVNANGNAITSLVMDNNLIYAANLGVVLQCRNNSITRSTITNNSIDASNSAIGLIVANNSISSANIENNQCLLSTSQTFISSVRDTSISDISLTSNYFAGAAGIDTIGVQILDNATSHWTLEKNQIIGGTSSVAFSTANAAVSNISISQNLITGSENQGISLTGQSSKTNAYNVTNNVFNGNADVAVLVSNMNGTTCLNFRNNSATPITEVNGTAVYEFVQTSGTFNLAPLVNNVGSLVQSGTITPVPSCD